MDKKTLTFIPSGGLANRMRAMASALNLYHHTGREVRVVWFKDWGLNARFCDIFEPLDCDGMTLREASLLDLMTVDRARSRNFYLPKLYQGMYFSKAIDEKSVTPLKQRGFNFDEWAKYGKRLYMSCYQVFGEFEDYYGLIRQLFKPVPAVMDKVNGFVSQFSGHTIGMHIRRTDNVESIQCSPIEKFLAIADKEIQADGNTKIFLATDDEDTKTTFRQRYGERIITPDAPASRGSLEGIQDGIVDMWTLARTSIIYGSKGSSFSPMASTIGGNALVIVS